MTENAKLIKKAMKQNSFKNSHKVTEHKGNSL